MARAKICERCGCEHYSRLAYVTICILRYDEGWSEYDVIREKNPYEFMRDQAVIDSKEFNFPKNCPFILEHTLEQPV